jgi:hypothetical protein
MQNSVVRIGILFKMQWIFPDRFKAGTDLKCFCFLNMPLAAAWRMDDRRMLGWEGRRKEG